MERISCLLTVADTLLAFFVFFPMVCLYWRGSWDLIGYYVLPGREPFNYLVHTLIGACTVFDYLLLPVLKKYLDPDKKVTYFLATRLFMAYHGILYMFLWRGVWMLSDHYVTRKWSWSLLAWTIDTAGLALVGCVRSLVWPPFVVCIDRGPDLLTAANRFHTKPENKCAYLWDSIFTALVVNCLAIFSWRSIWCVWDGIIYPQDLFTSDIVSFSIGCVGTWILFAMQNVFASVSERFEDANRPMAKRVWEVCLYVLIFVVMSTLWRGGWNLNVRYLITDPMTGGWVNHVSGAVLFLIFQTYSLVGGCGCGIDAGDPGGGAFFPVKYTQILLEPRIRHTMVILPSSVSPNYHKVPPNFSKIDRAYFWPTWNLVSPPLGMMKAEREAEDAKTDDSFNEIKYKPSNLDKDYKMTNLDKNHRVENVDKNYLLPNNVPLDDSTRKKPLLNNEAPPRNQWMKLRPTKDFQNYENPPSSGSSKRREAPQTGNPYKVVESKEEFGDPWVKRDTLKSPPSQKSNLGLKYANV